MEKEIQFTQDSISFKEHTLMITFAFRARFSVYISVTSQLSQRFFRMPHILFK